MPWNGRPPFLQIITLSKRSLHFMCQCPERGDLHFYCRRKRWKWTVLKCVNALKGATSISTMKQDDILNAKDVSMPWKGRPPFLHLPLGTRINKGFADPFLQVFSRIFWKRLFWRWFLACSQFVHIYRRNEGNFSLSAAPIITDFFRFHKQIISHYCDHYLRSHHPPAVSFRTGVHDPGIWLPLSSRVNALEKRWHLFERSELCHLFSAFSSRPGA